VSAHRDTGRLTPKGEATKNRIVSAAAELVFRQGAALTSTEAVQTAAGVSASQMYHYFKNKQQLLDAVIAFQTEDIVSRHVPYLRAIEKVDDFSTWKNVVVAIQNELNCEGGCPLGSLASELADSAPGTRDLVAVGFERWESLIHEAITRMVEAGVLTRDADVGLLSDAMMAALQGGLLLAKVRRTTRPLEAALDVVIERLRTYETSGFRNRYR